MPTSRATRVTSEAKAPSCSTILFTVFAVRKNSPSRGRPSISVAMVLDRSPFATAPITRATSLVGCTRSPIRSLTEPIVRAHESETSPSDALCVIRPSLPTTRRIRSSSCVIRRLVLITSLNVSAILPAMPVQSPGRRAEKSPRSNAPKAARSCLAFSSLLLSREPFLGRAT